MVLRKLTLALLGMGVMLPGLSHALAVRDIQTKSALGQPLRVEVELSDLGDLTSEDIRVGLATQEDFQRLGIERSFFLTDLRFEVVVNPGARSFIRVSSSKRVSEPFLDFVIRISWPGNTRLQELPILLDPPVVASSRPVEPAAPVVATVEPVPAARPEAPAPQPELMAAAPVAEPDQAPTYQVRRRDSLWSIAQRVRPARDISVPRMMQALYKANPQAFVANNINMLRDGQVLRVPTLGEVQSSGDREAAQMLSSRNSAAAEARKLSGKQINATAAASKPVTVTAQPRVEMKLVAADGGKNATGHPDSHHSASSRGKGGVAAAKPSQSGNSAPKPAHAAGLAGEVAALQSKLKINDTKIAMQNARLAQLEAQLKARAQEQAKNKGTDKHLERKAIATLACGVATQSFLSSEAKAADAPAKASGGSMMPVVGGVALLLIVAAIFFFKSRARKPEAPAARPAAPKPATPASAPAPTPVQAAPKPAPAPEVKKPADPLEEAQAYFNLERYPQAVGVLNKALAQTPDRSDLHLLLLEIFVRQNDRQSFEDQYARLESLGELEALFKADEIKRRLPEEVKHAAAPAHAEGVVEYAPTGIKKEDSAGPSLEDLEKDFALSLSQPNLKAVDVEIREPEQAAPAKVDELDALLDSSLEFNFTKSEPAPVETAPAADLDFAFEAPSAQPDSAAELSLDSLDAFLEENKVTPEAVAAPVEALPEFDFEKALSAYKEEEAVAAPEPVVVPEPVVETAAIEPVAAVDEMAGLAEGLELEEFNVSQINLPVTDVEIRHETQSGLEALDGDFNFDDFATTPEPVVEPAPAASFEAFESVDLGSAAAAFDAELAGQAAGSSLDDESGFDLGDGSADALAALDQEFSFLATTDENTTRLELARAYVEMGDKAAARDLLEEVVAEGKEDQRQEAQGMLMRIA
ncbi:FimV-like protein [Fluviicoccus keumensis]|uniref:FimV-like protein n=1 Tax=Fluviicoccus keumensis TaxID=1435465 RepID=A0A4V2G610_9GAMM|nr:FimV/HubP family polar landmark protein [Fluviicoccus keumensis]RZU46876.1 FimV-like protein [Fluviicoccus keumensis]